MKIKSKVIEKDAIAVQDIMYAKLSTLPLWVSLAISGDIITLSDGKLRIKTLEGTMTAQEEDYIVKGVLGELYPIKPEILMRNYDIVED